MKTLSLVLVLTAATALADNLIPPLSQIKPDHPRVFLRPKPTPNAISLDQLKSIERNAEFNTMLAQLKKQPDAASQAMVYLLTGDNAAADKAIARMRDYKFPGKCDTFHIFFKLTEFGLAYDWLYNHPAFTVELKAKARGNIQPLVAYGLKQTNDHMFHNYIWMSAGGVAIWSLATAGEDDLSSADFEKIRKRFNDGLYPAWRYLDGLPSEPVGYWSLYVFAPGVYTLLGAQSAFETDLVTPIRKQQNAWIDRHFENLIHSTLPDMRYIPWGDLQSGPNGGVTMEMAGIIDAATWLTKSPHGKQWSQWLSQKRGLARFYGETAVFYMLYSRQLDAQIKAPAAWPQLSFLAGNKHSGHFIARSSWDDDATLVAFTATDHFGDHHHYDQGSFIIYRKGLLAIDPPVYKSTRGPQQKTEFHNTLLIGGKPQRQARGQSFVTIEDFLKNLKGGKKLETGDILFSHDAGSWAAVSGQFAQAYDIPELQSCIRQLLFVRPGTVIVVDRLVAAPGQQVPEVKWLLQLPGKPQSQADGVVSSHNKSWIRCRSLLPKDPQVAIEATPVQTQCASFTCPGGAAVTLVHVLDVGEGTQPQAAQRVSVTQNNDAITVTLDGKSFLFAAGPEGTVSATNTPK